MRPLLATTLLAALATPALAEPTERRLHSEVVEASSFLASDKLADNYHPNYIADDDAATAWVEGAAASGAGDWVRINLSYTSDVSKVRVRVRNGYQKSKELFAANARAKDIVVKLSPSGHTMKATLADRDGWQEIVIPQATADLESIEIAVSSVYEGAKYTDLGISDVQVYATSTEEDNPAWEKRRRERLMQWRAQRSAAAKQFAARPDLPLYSGYAITTTQTKIEGEAYNLAGVVSIVAKDPVFAADWKDAIAIAQKATANLDALPRVQLSAKTGTKLVEVDGVQIMSLGQYGPDGTNLENNAFRLPMQGTVASLFADQLQVSQLRDKQTISKFEETYGACKDTLWALRKESKETGTQTLAVVHGKCAKVEGRGGWRHARTLEMVVFDAAGRAVLVIGEGHAEGYRWVDDNGKPMIASARSLMPYEETVIEAKKRETVAAK